jgi:hypothetical protein
MFDGICGPALTADERTIKEWPPKHTNKDIRKVDSILFAAWMERAFFNWLHCKFYGAEYLEDN